jgi:phosphoglycolate phosphatase
MLLLFDYDGVIADSLEAFHGAVAGLCRAAGRPELAEREAYLALFDGNLFEGLAARGLSAADVGRVVGGLPAALAAAYERVPLVPGMAEVLGHLGARHPLFVVTSNATAIVAGHLARGGVAGVREVLGAEAGTSKVEKVQRMAARFPGAAPWYVGDTLGDMREGRCAGATTVAVTWGWHDAARLRRGAPDHVVDRPADLLALLDGAAPAASGPGRGEHSPRP